MKDEIITIYTTINSIEVAKKLARELVNLKLVACVNIIPEIMSIYRWKGKIESEKEVAMILKTRKGNINKIRQIFKENHPYELPAFIVHRTIAVIDPYYQWIIDETS